MQAIVLICIIPLVSSSIPHTNELQKLKSVILNILKKGYINLLIIVSKLLLFNIDKISDLELATTAFGQGVSVTPIQQIAAVSAAINGGILYNHT